MNLKDEIRSLPRTIIPIDEPKEEKVSGSNKAVQVDNHDKVVPSHSPLPAAREPTPSKTNFISKQNEIKPITTKRRFRWPWKRKRSKRPDDDIFIADAEVTEIMDEIFVPLLAIECEGLSYPIENACLVIGRGKNSDIVVGTAQDRRISRQHCLIETDDGESYIVDTSTNGTYLNSNKLEKNKAYPIKAGDVIRVAHIELSIGGID